MLLQFNVNNSFSFKNDAILDLVAKRDTLHEKSLIPFKKTNILPTVAIYGANASGKTNLFKALAAAIAFVRDSGAMQIHDNIDIVPFAFNENSKDEKTKFDFIFVNNGIKYGYGFSADKSKVYEEYLYEYKTTKPSIIFERHNINEYRYTDPLRNVLKRYEVLNADNKLFLATATACNCHVTKNAFLWFKEAIEVYDHKCMKEYMIRQLEFDEEKEMKDFVLSILQKTGFNICDYHFNVEVVNEAKIELPPGISINSNAGWSKIRKWDIDIAHQVDQGRGTTKHTLSYHEESKGLQYFFNYIILIYKALKEGKTIAIDEMDDGIHSMLMRYIVNLFNDPEQNESGAQLLFNAHDMTLLDLDVFRRDEIYFVGKDAGTGESYIYSLFDYMPSTNANIQKRYAEGRYGAIPDVDF